MARIEIVGPDNDFDGPNSREESAERGWSWRRAVAAINAMFDELYTEVTGLTGKTTALTVTTDSVTLDRALGLPSYTVESAPEPAELADGLVIRVSNGNAGAPCLAVTENGQWLVVALGSAIAVE